MAWKVAEDCGSLPGGWRCRAEWAEMAVKCWSVALLMLRLKGAVGLVAGWWDSLLGSSGGVPVSLAERHGRPGKRGSGRGGREGCGVLREVVRGEERGGSW